MTYRISSLDLKAFLHESSNLLEGSFIRNIYQKGASFLFKLWTEDGKKHLLVEAGRRLNITKVMETGKATEMAKALRRHLRGKKIDTISQHKLDRIVEVRIGREYKLIVEFFNRGNLVLLKNDKIIIAQKHQHMRDRDLYPGKQYQYPPKSPKNPLEMDKEAFTSTITAQKDLVRGLVKFFGPKYAEELCARVDIDKNMPTEKLEASHVQHILREIKTLLSQITGDLDPRIYYEGEAPTHFTPMAFQSLEKFTVSLFSSLSEAIDQFYIERETKTEEPESAKRVKRTKEKLQARIEHQQEKIETFRENAKEYRKLAKAIYNHLRDLSMIVEQIKRAKKEKNLSWQEISQRISTDRDKHRIESVHQDGNVRIRLGDETVTLNIMESPQDKAERYFSKARKMEKRLTRAKEEVEKSKEKLRRIKEEGEEIKKEEEIIVKMPSRKWFEHFRWFKSSDDLLVIAGKDAETNEQLIKHHMNEGDIFVHAEVHGGAATVIKKTNGTGIPERTIKEAAIFAGCFSKAWESGFAGIDVYYSPADKVTLSPPSGEYLPKGGFMVKEKNYVKNVGLKTAVGVIINEKGEKTVSIKEIGGPTSAVSRQTPLYMVLKPGRKSKGVIAKDLKRRLKHKAENEKEEKAIDTLKKEKFLRFIPSKSEIETVSSPSPS